MTGVPEPEWRTLDRERRKAATAQAAARRRARQDLDHRRDQRRDTIADRLAARERQIVADFRAERDGPTEGES